MTAREAKRFYAEEEEARRYLPAYSKYDRNQMRKMTHLEYFACMDQVVLFDYRERNPINQEARTCIFPSEEIKEKKNGEEKDKRDSGDPRPGIWDGL